ncbi:MAG TPA: 4-alpha-glucanotransferase, partial [Chryseosolibacter sp.]|nr:4-alpha-glucanotransferase [Chryseosolibacter sp.]
MTKQRRASIKKINETPLREGRGAGVLMHITSLPSPFGTGDLGPEARKFAEFLHQSGQRYWQILPLSPTGEDQHYSPYSSASTMAGNPLLISPDLLVDDDLITPQDLKKFHVANNGTANFREASLVRDVLFEKGYRTFLSNSQNHGGFRDFCRKESYWLDDFALYTVLKALHEDKPWYEWPAPYRNRQQKALSDINRFHF